MSDPSASPSTAPFSEQEFEQARALAGKVLLLLGEDEPPLRIAVLAMSLAVAAMHASDPALGIDKAAAKMILAHSDRAVALTATPKIVDAAP